MSLDSASAAPVRPKLSTLLRRGLARRCPRCGKGPLFVRWVDLHERCSACGMRLLRNQGDPWAFLLLIDRAAFIFPVVVALYLGLHLLGPLLFGLFGAVVLAVFVATMPHRYGVCVAVDTFTRMRWGDLAPGDDGAPGNGRGG